MNNGTERPIAFASRKLTKTEQGYAQIGKEALAMIWGVKKFHVYLYGRPFTLYINHWPLTSIFHPYKSIPVVTAAGLSIMHYSWFIRIIILCMGIFWNDHILRGAGGGGGWGRSCTTQRRRRRPYLQYLESVFLS